MGFLNRKNKLARQVAHGVPGEALGRVQSLAARCEHVRTAQGRTAHLREPDASPGVLCGWPGPWMPADPSLPVCKLCEIAAEAADMERAAS